MLSLACLRPTDCPTLLSATASAASCAAADKIGQAAPELATAAPPLARSSVEKEVLQLLRRVASSELRSPMFVILLNPSVARESAVGGRASSLAGTLGLHAQ